MKKAIKWLIISLSAIILLVGIAFLVLLLLLTPQRLTPIVNKYCTEYLDATVTFDSVKVSLFEEFPKVSLTLVGGEIISNALKSDTAFLALHPESVDTLLRFNEFMVSLNVKDLMKSKVNIERVRISQPYINGYISPSGKANWDIIAMTGSDSPLDLNIDRIAIRGPAILNYKSCPDSMAIQASIGRLFLKGHLNPDLDKLELSKFVCSNLNANVDIRNDEIHIGAVIDSAVIDVVEQRKEYKINIQGVASTKIEKQLPFESLPLKLNGTLKLDPENLLFFGFQDFCLGIANLPELKLNGDLVINEGDITSDLQCKIEKIPLQSLFTLIPKEVSEEIQKIQTDVIISLSAKIKGSYEFVEKGKLPFVDIDFKIPKGELTYKDLESKIENIIVDASFHFNPDHPMKTGIELRTINFEAYSMKLNGNVEVTNLFDDPFVSMKIIGFANLRELQKFVPDDMGFTARGNISFDAQGSFLASRLNMQDFAKNDLVVNFKADRVRLRLPNEALSILAEKTSLELNTTKTRTNRTTGEITKLLSVDFNSDTARIRMHSRETVAISKVNFSMRTNDALITGDNSKVIPMIGNITANSLEYSDIDSTTLRLREFKTNFRILPSRENPTMPSIRFEIETKQLSTISNGSRFSIRDANVSIVATKNELVENNRTQRQNSRPQEQRNRAADDFTGDDIDIKDAEISAMLREWKVDGSIKSRNGRVISPLFPLRTRLQNLDIAFTTNDVTLNNLDIKCGESKLNITGKIDGIRRALASGRGLKISADIKADTLNLNQMLAAVYKGNAYANASEEYKKSVANATDEDQLEKIIQVENDGKDEKDLLVVVPSNIAVDVKIDVGYGKYADVIIHKLTGELISRDRCIQLKDIVAKTSLGEIDVTALYATRSKKDITFGLDLEFKDIQLEDFIKIIPSVDSLAPMLASFRGLVNAQVAATSAMDTTMNIILSTLNAACRINGKNLVLLDGETFSEIAKTLKFKNRDKNLVERISVEMLINNNQIEVFPFVMQMDRYKTAISGIHKLDMTFNYHISVLQSPLPFKLGINLKGDVNNMNKMKIGLGRALYKDTNLPTYVTVIDTTRYNLRTQINNFIQQGVDVARFSQFFRPAVDISLIEEAAESNGLSAQDSLMLQKEGIIE